MPRNAARHRQEPLRVSLLVLPDATIGSVTGMLDTRSCFPLLGTFDDAVPQDPPFRGRARRFCRGRCSSPPLPAAQRNTQGGLR